MTEFEDEPIEATDLILVQRKPEFLVTWPQRFLEFFREIESPLSVILNADGCREGWLHGELFRHFQTAENGFRINHAFSGGRIKHDLYCVSPTEMLAEVKVYPKNFRGPTRSFVKKLKSQGPLSREAIQTLGPKTGSLFSDFLRLMELAVTSNCREHYIILVMQKAGNDDLIGEISALGVPLIVGGSIFETFQVIIFKL